MPVAIDDAPVPSRSTATSTSVSLVVRFTDALRMTVSCAICAPFIRAWSAAPIVRAAFALPPANS